MVLNDRDIKRFRRPDIWEVWRQRVLKKLGLVVIATSVARDVAVQYVLFLQGRKPLLEVNKARAVAGLRPITEKENASCVTWTLNSKHLINLANSDRHDDLADAVDYCIVNKGTVVWDVKADINHDNKSDYRQCADEWLSLGRDMGIALIAGADFKHPDYPHLQLPT